MTAQNTHPNLGAPCVLEDRAVIRVSGPDTETFLEGLLTQSVLDFETDTARYGALLTPQGKVMSAMILFKTADALYIDLEASVRDAILRRLMMYKLRADVELEAMDGVSVVVSNHEIKDALVSATDPRSDALGYRSLVLGAAAEKDRSEYDALRYHAGVAEGSELALESDFWLETDAERLNGVSFTKGCYVGQELTARMKHRTSVKKKIVTIEGNEDLPAVGTEIKNGADRVVGDIRAAAGNVGLAFLRLERLDGTLSADGQTIHATLRD